MSNSQVYCVLISYVHFPPSHLYMKNYQWHFFASCISSPQNKFTYSQFVSYSFSWISSLHVLLLHIPHNQTFLLACFSDICFSWYLLVDLISCFLQYFNTCTVGRADGNCQLQMTPSSFCASGDSKSSKIHVGFCATMMFSMPQRCWEGLIKGTLLQEIENKHGCSMQ